MTGRLAAELPPAVAPAAARLITAPRLLELCFQTAGVVELGASGRLALPARVRQVDIHQPASDTAPCVAVIARSDAGGFDAEVVGDDGIRVMEVRGYETVEVPLSIDDRLLDPFRAAVRT
jgi:hypothetical protein